VKEREGVRANRRTPIEVAAIQGHPRPIPPWPGANLTLAVSVFGEGPRGTNTGRPSFGPRPTPRQNPQHHGNNLAGGPTLGAREAGPGPSLPLNEQTPWP